MNQIALQGRSFAGESVAEYHTVYTGDIVYTKSPLKANPYGIIKTNNGKPGIVSTLYAVYHPLSTVIPRFVEYYFCNNLRLNKFLKPLVNIGAKHDMKVNNEFVLTGDVIFPSIVEQQSIVAFLSLIDERIVKQQILVEHLKKYKRGLLQTVFSREVQLENSSSWEHRLFSEIASLGKGKYAPKQKETLPCIELEHIEQQTGQIIGYANSNEQNSVKSVFHKGDVLFGKLRPYLRKFALPEHDGVCSSEIWVLHPEANIDSAFLFYLIQSESFIAAANISSGTKMPRAEWSKVSNESFFIPELTEQKRIAELFGAIDKRIANASRCVNQMQILKQGLLQQLFI